MSLLYRTLNKKIVGEDNSYPAKDAPLPLKDVILKKVKKRSRLRGFVLVTAGISTLFAAFFLMENTGEKIKTGESPVSAVNLSVSMIDDGDPDQNGLADCLVKGYFHYSQKDWDKALMEFERGVAGKSEQPAFYNDLGVVYYQNGKIDMAIEKIRESVRLNSDYPEAHFNLAIILEEKGDFAEAMKHYRKFVSLAKDHYPSLAGEIRYYLFHE